MELPPTLTEALPAGQIRLIETGSSWSQSGRRLPYDEVYRGFTAVIETPAEQLQRAGDEDEEAKRF